MRFLPLILLALLAACAPLHAPAPAPAVPPGMAQKLLERLAAEAGAFGSLQGLAKVRVTSGGRTLSATQVLLAKKPDRLRSEVLSPFGQPMLLLASDGTDLEVLVPSEGRFYRGEATPENIRRFTHLPLGLTDLVHLLLYQVPLPAAQGGRVEGVSGGLYRLRLQGAGDGRQEFYFDSRLHLVRALYYREGTLLLRVRYGKFSDGAHPFPRHIEVELPQQGAKASLTFSDLRTNVAIPAERFVLNPPAGAAVLPIP